MKRDSFWKLLESEHPRAEAFCRRLSGNRQDGDDLYQDSLLIALSRFESLRQIDSFRPWLYRIIVNKFKSNARSPWLRRRANLESLNMPEQPCHDPSDAIAARQLLERAMKPLKSSDKALVMLFEIEGWSVKELGEMFGRPSGTIKSKLSRARARMREELAANFEAHDFQNKGKGGKICVAGKQNVD